MRTLLALSGLIALATGTVRADASLKEVERRLHVTSVEASSFLWNDWNAFQENYHPNYIADDDPTTAWVEGQKGVGKGEWVRMRVTPLRDATRLRLRVRNGYQKSDRLWKANGRPRTVTVTLLPSKVAATRTLVDQMGWQELLVDQPRGPLEAIELRVDDVTPGEKYEDTCVSDVQIFVTASTPDNPALERARFARLVAWKRERVEAARLFKSASGKAMPIGPQYTTREEGESLSPPRGCDDALCRSRFALASLGADTLGAELAPRAGAVAKAVKPGLAGWRPVQVALKDKRPLPRVDGVCSTDLYACNEGIPCGEGMTLPLDGELGWLSTAQLGVFDVKEQPKIEEVISVKHPKCRARGETTTFAWALPGASGVSGASGASGDGRASIEALVVARCGAIESRDGYEPASQVQILVYGASGRLEAVATPITASALGWRERSGAEGPLLARGRVVSVAGGTSSRTVELAAEVARAR